MAFLTQYWPIILVAAIIGIITGYFYFKPRQRVRLQDNTPLRPHMAASAAPSEPAHAKPDGHIPGLETGANALASGDDLQMLKGVGPKLADLLHHHGITKYEQLAHMTPPQVEALDATLGAFAGRLTRDRVIEQADYLARGDKDGYRAKFGNLQER